MFPDAPRCCLHLQVCDTVAELAAITLAGGGSGWPELLPFLSQAVQSGQPRLMEASLLIFAQLAGHMMDTLLQFLGTLLQVRFRKTPLVLPAWGQASGKITGMYQNA